MPDAELSVDVGMDTPVVGVADESGMDIVMDISIFISTEE
jgi:hypothetical protein